MQSFCHTRGENQSSMTFQDAILHPMSDVGGLFTLSNFPMLPCLDSLLPLDYVELAQYLFKHLELETQNINEALKQYQSFDDPFDPAPISHLNDHFYLQELYHGPSRSFKDMALQPLATLFSLYAEKEKYLLLTATSGDTGPATLEAFKDMDNVFIVCLYPDQGTSDVQRLQMNMHNRANIKILPILGNFDDAQHSLKTLITDPLFASFLKSQGFKLSVSNSVNFGRIAFQIIYHIWGYLSLVRKGVISLGEQIYSVIPSGNFGNALGAFYAKLMGLPLAKIIIASNANNILTDFITSGIYDLTKRSLLQTLSPAMDILRSSNIERMLFSLFGGKQTKHWMESLNKSNQYSLTIQETQTLQEFFQAGFCLDSQCLHSIQSLAEQNLIIDPHTANAYTIAKELPKDRAILISSTAEWSKFSPTMVYAICKQKLEDQQALEWISSQFNLPIHPNIQSLFDKEEPNLRPIRIKNIKKEIMNWLIHHPSNLSAL